ncbi:MAG: UDP-N-acetylmuramate dehydrogenase [Saprospiraceae bacterium]|nr:UDP-N-acetylmuramate dehydrogenase [Saprospiraceae bacterium]
MISIKGLHTFGCEVQAEGLIEINTPEDLFTLYQKGFFSENKWLLLGGGSNVLFKNDFNGSILLNCIKGKEIRESGQDSVVVRFGSGEVWHEVVRWSLNNGFNGIENLSLIPGTIGAAPIQNIGAYGVELKDVFRSLQAFDTITGEVVSMQKEECRFGYRDSVFKHELKGRMIIISVSLELRKDGLTSVGYGDILKTMERYGLRPPYKPADVSKAVIEIRQSKLPDPAILGNAGSFFKNPVISSAHFEKLKVDFPDLPGYPDNRGEVKVPAGWLIERCGFKGKRYGSVGCHEKQALVLVNYGNGTGEEIIQLSREIQEAVRLKYKVDIYPEVNIIG